MNKKFLLRCSLIAIQFYLQGMEHRSVDSDMQNSEITARNKDSHNESEPTQAEIAATIASKSSDQPQAPVTPDKDGQHGTPTEQSKVQPTVDVDAITKQIQQYKKDYNELQKNYKELQADSDFVQKE